MMKFIQFIGATLLFISTSLFAQTDILYESKGDTSIVERKEFEGFSLRIPEFENPTQIYKERRILIFPIVFNSDFSIVLSVTLEEKPEDKNLLVLLNSDLNKNGKSSIWDDRTLHQFIESEKQFGNFLNRYMKSGHSIDKLHMKIFNSMYYLENDHQDKVLKFVSSISVSPSHKHYNNYEEIKNYMYDMKIYILTAQFK